MEQIKIKNVFGVFGNLCKIAEEGTKKTLFIYYPRAGKQTRRTRDKNKDNPVRKVMKGRPGTPYKVYRWSWGDPAHTAGFKRGITKDGLFFKYKFHRHDTAVSGTKWVATMEHGGPGLPGQLAVAKMQMRVWLEIKKQYKIKNGWKKPKQHTKSK